MSSPLIRIRGLRKTYGDAVAVSHLDLDVHRGEIVGLLGPNGAGKSTTLETVCTLRRPSAGEVLVAGVDVTRDPRGVRSRIGTVLQTAALDPVMTGREVLLLQARLRGLVGPSARSAAEAALRSLDILDRADVRIGTLSGGQRRRVDIAAAVVGGTDVLVLDEPTVGLDPVSRRGLWTHLRRLADEGVAVLLSTQDLQEAEVLADRLVVLRAGAVVAAASTAELKASVGTRALVLELAGPAQRATAAALARDRGLPAVDDAEGPDAPAVDADAEAAGPERTVSLRVRLGAHDDGATTASYLADLVGAGIEVRGLALDVPTLDDVYLHLTADASAGAATTIPATHTRRLVETR